MDEGDPVKRALSDAAPRTRKRGPRVRYHLVDLRGNGYRGGYLDADVRILFACFKLFEEFYEAEYPGPVKWEPRVSREIEALHAWWKRGRREVQKKAERLSRACRLVETKTSTGRHRRAWVWRTSWRSPAAKRKWMAAWKKAEEQDQKMLLRLMTIREWLWT